jgi:zinc transport system permease protein
MESIWVFWTELFSHKIFVNEVNAVQMIDFSIIYDFLSWLLPFDVLQARFMQQALLGLIILAPMAAVMGVQVVTFRMAFFSDAISHSAFAGVALGLLTGLDPFVSMPVFALLVGLVIMAFQRGSSLSSDTVIGVVFSAVIAFGLAIVSRNPVAGRSMEQFLYGDILTIGEEDILLLLLLFVVLTIFQVYSFNRLIYIGLSQTLAKAHRVRIALYQYIFAAFLSLIVILSVWAVGVLLVTAMLIVPAAAARLLARGVGAMFWLSALISVISAIAGLILSAQPWMATATGATIILVMFFCFVVAAVIRFCKR